MMHIWIPTARIEPMIGPETYVVGYLAAIGSWLIYRLFLTDISERRHESMRRRFFRLAFTLLLSSVFASSYWALISGFSDAQALLYTASYVSLAALITGAFVVIRIAQIYLYLYLFFKNMSVGVPRLITNMFTLVFGSVLMGWLAYAVFGVKITPLLATSALFSVILGLALQDTLGNLFSGVGLQLDKPFGIGDWVEVQNGSQKWVGQIQEVTWRATLLMGFGDELISIPNRTMAQSQVLVFTHSQKPPRRSQMFRFPFGTPIASAKKALLASLEGIPQILEDPAPVALVTETTEFWITIKVFYSLQDYGRLYRVGDQVLTRALEEIERAGLRLANPQLLPLVSNERALSATDVGLTTSRPVSPEIVQASVQE